MKKTALVLFCSILFNSLYAQLSDRSKPFSFSYKISQINKITIISEKINLPFFNLDSLKNEDAINDTKKGVYRFGYNHTVNLTTENSGYWTELENGDKVWQLEIASHNAKTLNLAFSDFKLPKGAKLWVFNIENNDCIGAFNSDINSEDGYFATDIILGNSLVIEYYLPAGVSQKNPFTLFRVTHGYRGFGIKSDEKLYGDAGSCNVNVNCPTGDNWQDQKRASAYTIGSSGNEVCSGSLINNVLNDGTPYFLTANHCYNSFGNLSLMVFKFNFEAPTCTYTSGVSPSHDALTGATLVARNSGSDFCLLLLKDNLPSSYNLFLSGWNRSSTVTDSVVCIHHPAGDVTKISFAPDVTAANYSGAQTWETGTWGDIDGDDVSDIGGVTEGGSSGSPIYDENKRIIGQLYGGPSSCSATGTNRVDYYGRVDVSWNTGTTPETRLIDWLDPCNSGSTGIDGIFANSPTTYSNEAKFISVANPENNSNTCNTSFSPIIKVQNNSVNTISTLAVAYTIAGITNASTVLTTTINAGATANVTIPEIQNITAGSHVISFTITQVNGVADENACNNSGTSSFTVLDLSATSITSFTEGFESGTFPPSGFSIKNEDSGSVTWEQNNSNGGFANTSKSMKMSFWSSDENQADYFHTPFFTLAEKNSAKIYFDLAHKRFSTSSDSLIISISEDCGSTWINLYSKGGTSLVTAGSSFSQFNSVLAANWRTDTINLDGFLEGPSLQIRFKAKSGNGNNMFIDNINLVSAFIDTSIPDNVIENNKSKITLFPNPVDNNLTLIISEINVAEISIYSSIGTLVKTIDSNIKEKQNIDVSTLSKGVYFIKISDKENNKHYSKFIKN
ncbi:MAG: T9SS type A sorting domain-containing protein [Bacteroidota bacterium]